MGGIYSSIQLTQTPGKLVSQGVDELQIESFFKFFLNSLFLILILQDALCSEIIYQIKYSNKMLSTKKTHFSFHQILAFATVVNLVQLDSVLLLPPQGFRTKSEIPRMYPSSSRG